MNFKRIISISVLMFLIISTLCCAAELSVTVSERTLSAEGECGNGNEKVSILILPVGVTPSDLDEMEGDILSKVIYLGRATLENGKLDTEINLPGRMESNSYKLYVIGESETSEKEFVFRNPDDILRLVDTLSGMTDKDEFFETIIASAEELGVRIDEFEKITDETKRITIMQNIQRSISSQEGTPVEKFRNAFYDMVIEFLLEGEYSGEELKLWSSQYFKKAGIDETYVNKIIEESLENKLAEMLGNKSYEGISDIEEKVTNASFFVRFAAAETKGLRFSVYSDYGKEKLGITAGIFGGYSEKDVLDNFTTNKFSDMNGFENEIRKAVSILNAASTPSFGGGGGGGGGSSSRIEYTPEEPEKKPIPEKKYEFSDLKGYEWAKEPVALLLDKGVISESENGKFRPSDYVTREEFVKMLVTALNIEADGNMSFADVSSDSWCYSYVKKAYASGIISGISEEKFGTGKDITRQDIAVILERAIKKYNLKTDVRNPDKKFSDGDKISEYARETVKLMGEYGIINGYEDGSFRPFNFATRAETAVLISKIIK